MTELDTVFKQKADYYDNALLVFTDFRQGAYGRNIPVIKWIADFSIFTLLAAYDIWIILFDNQRAIKKYQQNYYARQASLLCFELLSDISQHFDDNFTQLNSIIMDELLVNEISKVRKDFNRLRSDNEHKLKEIRDKTAAHRDHSITNQIEILNKVDIEWTMEFSLNYLKKIEELHSFFNKIIKIISKDLKELNVQEFQIKYDIDKTEK